MTQLALAALLLGIAAGLRSMMPVAAVSIAAARGALPVANTTFAFLQYPFVGVLAALFAIGELIGDKSSRAPSRKAFIPFVGRMGSGAACGAILAASQHASVIGAVAGAAGAVIGTVGGYAARQALARAFGRDLPAALIEDAAAILVAAAAIALSRV